MPRRCEYSHCNKHPVYNNEGEVVGRFCVEHKEPQMVNIRSKRCQHPGCTTEPVYNNTGELRGCFCAEHKEPQMVNVRCKRCQHPGCNKRPSYNNEGKVSGRFCAEHKHPRMVNVNNKRCQYQGCIKCPKYNNEGEVIGRFCVEHKEPYMIDVQNKRCQHPGCIKRPVYNNEGKVRGRFCLEHKEPQMVDVVNKRCQDPGCKSRCRYGYPGHRATWCAQHKGEGMISNPRTICVEATCREAATHGISKAVHCILHFKYPEVSLVGGTCVSCGLIDILDKESRCALCDPSAFQRVRLAKQREVKLWLDGGGHGDYVIYDKVIDQGLCGKERPDFAFDCGTHYVIVEVDENQHSDRQETCECVRMVNISQSVGMKTIFLRYNPDPFKSAGRKQNPGFTRRRDTVLRWLTYLRATEPEHFLSVIHLFYDGYEDGKVAVVPIFK